MTLFSVCLTWYFGGYFCETSLILIILVSLLRGCSLLFLQRTRKIFIISSSNSSAFGRKKGLELLTLFENLQNQKKKKISNLNLNVKMSGLVKAAPFNPSSTRVTPSVKFKPASSAVPVSNPQRTSGSDGGVSKAATIVGDGSSATNTFIVEGGGTRVTPSVKFKPASSSTPTSKPVFVSSKPSISIKGVGVKSKSSSNATSKQSTTPAQSVFDRLYSRTPRVGVSSQSSPSTRSPVSTSHRTSSASGGGAKSSPGLSSVSQAVAGVKRSASAVEKSAEKAQRVVRMRTGT